VRPWLRRLGLRWRIALGVLAVALIAGVAALVISAEAGVDTYRQSEEEAAARRLPPIAFTFDHSDKLRITKPPGAYVRAERFSQGMLAARFTVAPFRLRPQPGLPAGYLPILATRLEHVTARRFEGFRLQFEGRARVNEVEGYQYAFRARLPRPGGAPRQLFGRVVMLLEPYDIEDPDTPYPPGETPTRGVLVTMLSTTLESPDEPIRVGDEGSLQRPFRSFRFGSG
jgi:hypothetical protein